MGSGDDGAHSQNEKIEVRNYIEGVSVIIFTCYCKCFVPNNVKYLLHSNHLDTCQYCILLYLI